MDLTSLVDQPNKLPTIPKVAQKLLESFSSDDVTIEAIASQLAADPALSAKLLRLANSAYFHLSRTIGTVEDAVHMLGFVMVRNLVLGNGMVAAFRNTPGIDIKQFWHYNLYTACASRWLASTAHADGDMAFTLGLMHAIGQLQMHAVAPREMAALDRQLNVLNAGRAELEMAALNFHYGDVSAELARIWNFPQPLIGALRSIPQPLASDEFSEMAAWVHMGAWRARAEVLGLRDEEIVASYPRQVGKRLRIAPDWLPALAAHANTAPKHCMPALKELTEGLDAMLD